MAMAMAMYNIFLYNIELSEWFVIFKNKFNNSYFIDVADKKYGNPVSLSVEQAVQFRDTLLSAGVEYPWSVELIKEKTLEIYEDLSIENAKQIWNMCTKYDM